MASANNPLPVNNKKIEAPIIILIGPTAVGKTELSLSIAEQYSCEIVGADSMQVYRYMDIGTAKPTKEEMGQVNHHLINVANPDEDFHAGRYASEAFAACQTIIAKGKMPLVVGGTGLYIRALTEGLFDVQPANKEERAKLRQRLAEEGREALFEELELIDPDSAKRIHPHDSQRVIRALEIYHATGKSWSKHLVETKKKTRFSKILQIGLTCERQKLYQRINLRTERMIENGFQAEVEGLFNMGYKGELKSMQSLGYRHMVQFINGNWDLDKTISLLARDTRRFAKRQFTWFGRDEQIRWVDVNDDGTIYSLIQDFTKQI